MKLYGLLIVKGLLLATVFTAGAWWGARVVAPAHAEDPVYDTLRVRRLEVIDDTNRARIVLRTENDGAYLTIWGAGDPRQNPNMTLYTNDKYATVDISERVGLSRVGMSVIKESGAMVTLNDYQKKIRWSVTSNNRLPITSHAQMSWYDAAGTPFVTLPPDTK